MTTGTSRVYYPNQSNPPLDLDLDDSYFLVKLHDAQAFFEAGWLAGPGSLVVTSSVESSFQTDTSTQSLHKISTLRRNTPCHLGINTYLTRWLPANSDNWLHIKLKYTVVRDQTLRDLMDHMERTGLEAKVSLIRPDLDLAMKVSQIVGQLVSYLRREGRQEDIFDLTMELNPTNLKTGYHVVIGSHSDQYWPSSLKIDANGNLLTGISDSLSNFSYAVFEVLTVKRRGTKKAEEQPWWELLETVKTQMVNANPVNEQERTKLLNDWRYALALVRQLTLKQQGYLDPEIKEILAAAHVEVENTLAPGMDEEAAGFDEYPTDLQDLLGVSTGEELRQLVHNYQVALDGSQRLLVQYQLSGD